MNCTDPQRCVCDPPVCYGRSAVQQRIALIHDRDLTAQFVETRSEGSEKIDYYRVTKPQQRATELAEHQALKQLFNRMPEPSAEQVRLFGVSQCRYSDMRDVDRQVLFCCVVTSLVLLCALAYTTIGRTWLMILVQMAVEIHLLLHEFCTALLTMLWIMVTQTELPQEVAAVFDSFKAPVIASYKLMHVLLAPHNYTTCVN